MITTLTWIDIFIIVATPLGVLGLAALSGVLRFGAPGTSPASSASMARQANAPAQACHSFEFDPNGLLVCANETAMRFLNDVAIGASDWSALRSELLARFSTLPAHVAPSDKARITTYAPNSPADPMELLLERHDAGFSILLKSRADAPLLHTAEFHRTLSNLDNIELLQAATEHAPFPIWQTLPGGVIGWTNACYRQLDTSIERNAPGTNAPLFELPEGIKPGDQPRRMAIKDKGRNRTYWFDVTPLAFDSGMIHFAIDVHATVNAEAAQRNFVQTLAKTFAHLATGLAIFDRNRQLVLFNPALIDLTELQPDFLTARPNLFSFFDQLRDRQIMPEPKSYANWRERVADVVSAASDDNFSETWHLPSGITYRVTGRPHPDGAIAFLFEDITAEISLTRKFRAEAAITQSALDALDSCVAIFNEAGFLVHCNTAMRAQLEIGADTPLGDHTVHEISRLWRAQYKPSPVWGEIRDFISGATERVTWTAHALSKSGAAANIQVSPLKAGATMVRIQTSAPLEKAKPAAEVAA